ncbi:MAG: Hint domain-containing protein [Hyphomonadaceae bacterium]|nr:Hint domain-containing protein [Hyphomonadaceae bacterium]
MNLWQCYAAAIDGVIANGEITFDVVNFPAGEAVLISAGGKVVRLGFVNELKNLGRTISNCGCFVEGTLVATPEGLVPIETISVGDLVMAYDEATGKVEAKPEPV